MVSNTNTLTPAPTFKLDEARNMVSYFGTDMNFMIWWGERDSMFPIDESLEQWDGVFDSLQIQSTLKVEHRQPLQGHTITETELSQVMDFIRSL